MIITKPVRSRRAPSAFFAVATENGDGLHCTPSHSPPCEIFRFCSLSSEIARHTFPVCCRMWAYSSSVSLLVDDYVDFSQILFSSLIGSTFSIFPPSSCRGLSFLVWWSLFKLLLHLTLFFIASPIRSFSSLVPWGLRNYVSLQAEPAAWRKP